MVFVKLLTCTHLQAIFECKDVDTLSLVILFEKLSQVDLITMLESSDCLGRSRDYRKTILDYLYGQSEIVRVCNFIRISLEISK